MHRAPLAYLLCVILAGCGQSNDLPWGIRPDSDTRVAAQNLPLSQVKTIELWTHCNLPNGLISKRSKWQAFTITDRATIRLLVDGLKAATQTGIGNQVCGIKIQGRNGQTLIYRQFALDYPSHAISPTFIKGLHRAGVILPWEEQERHRQQVVARLKTTGLILAPVLLLSLALFRWSSPGSRVAKRI